MHLSILGEGLQNVFIYSYKPPKTFHNLQKKFNATYKYVNVSKILHLLALCFILHTPPHKKSCKLCINAFCQPHNVFCFHFYPSCLFHYATAGAYLILSTSSELKQVLESTPSRA